MHGLKVTRIYYSRRREEGEGLGSRLDVSLVGLLSVGRLAVHVLRDSIGGWPRLIILEDVVTFRGCGFVMAAELAEAQVREACLACV